MTPTGNMKNSDFSWLSRNEPIPLAENEIHIWRASTNLPQPVGKQLARWLSPDELSRSERYRFDRDRMRFIASRGILRMLLGSYLEMAPNQLIFDYSLHGKPNLSPVSTQTPIQFNLSHSEDICLFAFTKNARIGVDLEYLHPIPDVDQICERYFSAGEKRTMRSLPEDQKLEAFFTGWTRKEAYVKALGGSLLPALDQFEVSLLPGESSSWIKDVKHPEMNDIFVLISLVPLAGYLAAIAVENKPWVMRQFEYRLDVP
jgi:4'-phosphopantetheinyl transferase